MNTLLLILIGAAVVGLTCFVLFARASKPAGQEENEPEDQVPAEKTETDSAAGDGN